MQRESAESGCLLGPLEYHPLVPVEPAAASQGLGWTGLEAARLCDLTDAEFVRPALSHHALILFTEPPDELDLRYEDVKRHRPPPLGSVSVVQAGIPTHWRWRGTKSSLQVYLQPDLVERVAVEVFGLDPARGLLPPLDAVDKRPQVPPRDRTASPLGLRQIGARVAQATPPRIALAETTWLSVAAATTTETFLNQDTTPVHARKPETVMNTLTSTLDKSAHATTPNRILHAFL